MRSTWSNSQREGRVNFYLDYIAQQVISHSILLLNFRKLIGQSKRVGLEVQVGVLPAWDFIFIHVGITSLHCDCTLKWRVQLPGSFPVLAVFMDPLDWNS